VPDARGAAPLVGSSPEQAGLPSARRTSGACSGRPRRLRPPCRTRRPCAGPVRRTYGRELVLQDRELTGEGERSRVDHLRAARSRVNASNRLRL